MSKPTPSPNRLTAYDLRRRVMLEASRVEGRSVYQIRERDRQLKAMHLNRVGRHVQDLIEHGLLRVKHVEGRALVYLTVNGETRRNELLKGREVQLTWSGKSRRAPRIHRGAA